MGLRKASLSGAVAALVICVAPARADFFVGGYYTPITGHVGQILNSDAAFDVRDMPPGCIVLWKSITVSGSLPPGLAPPGANLTLVAPAKDENGIPIPTAEVPEVAASAFYGTPSKVGDWPLVVTFHDMACSGGQNYGDRSIKATFHIVP